MFCVFFSPQGTLKPVALQDLSRVSAEELELVPSPATGTPGALTAPREFNLMFQTNVGAMAVRAVDIYWYFRRGCNVKVLYVSRNLRFEGFFHRNVSLVCTVRRNCGRYGRCFQEQIL